MSELGELFRDWNEDKKAKKRDNAEKSLQILLERVGKYRINILSPDHFRLGDYDFWPSTGLFIHLKTKKRGRGVFNLIDKLGRPEPTAAEGEK
jgi:hypothetical protein